MIDFKLKHKTERDVRRFLLELGDTTDHVASEIRSYPLKGRTYNAADCPIAQYLNLRLRRNNTHNKHMVFVAPINTLVNLNGKEAWIQNPPAVREFIVNFDHMDYPDLVVV